MRVDWSVAPIWANWWACDLYPEYSESRARWFHGKPTIGVLMGGGYWTSPDKDADHTIGGEYQRSEAPEFGFSGNWKDSLTGRPLSS